MQRYKNDYKVGKVFSAEGETRNMRKKQITSLVLNKDRVFNRKV